MMTMTMIMLSSSPQSLLVVQAKEIEATHEWQILQEGDTIPAGLHVKMDLETGTKWVKLMDEDEDTDQSALSAIPTTLSTTTTTHDSENNDNVEKRKGDKTGSHSSGIKITQLKNTQISPETSTKITSQLLKQAQEDEARRVSNFKSTVAALNDFDGDTTLNEKDYEMMYRTLMSLPEEDREELGIPTFPEVGDGQEIPKEELEHFIEKIKEIWSQRQAELKQMEEEHMANIPDIIKERILFLQEYVSSPLKYLKDVVVIGNNDQKDLEENNDNGDAMNIFQVLEDLEFHLMDIDLTRDFYILQGWPLLVSLLTDDIHRMDDAIQEIVTQQNWTSVDIDSTTSQQQQRIMELPEEKQLYLRHIRDAIWKVQTLASWSIGTAVKNIDEFHWWAIEDLSGYMNSNVVTASSSHINVISILLSKLQTANESNIIASSLVHSKPWLQMKQKEIYALGALLRGNKDAVEYFNSVDGATTLSQFFHSIIASSVDESILNDNAGSKLLLRIMMLGIDLMTELEERTESIISLTNEHWCQMPTKMVANTALNVQRQAIDGMVILAPHCEYIEQKIIASLLEKVDDPDIKELLMKIT